MLAALTAFALLQERVVLDLEEPLDVTFTVTKTIEEQSRVTERSGRGPTTEFKTSATSTHRYEETLLARDVPTWRRRYLETTESFTENGRTTTRRPAFDGRTITLKKEDGETKVEGATLDKGDLAQLRLRDDPILASLPTSAIVPGARWAIEPRRLAGQLAEQLGGFSVRRAEGSTEFARWESFGGERCAVLESTTRVEAVDARGAIVVVAQNTVTHWYAPTRKAMVRVDGDGRHEINGTVAEQTVGGSSTTTYRERRGY